MKPHAVCLRDSEGAYVIEFVEARNVAHAVEIARETFIGAVWLAASEVPRSLIEETILEALDGLANVRGVIQTDPRGATDEVLARLGYVEILDEER